MLSQPRHRLVESALTDARDWCRGRVIDERPALVHAVTVAAVLGRHVVHPEPALVAAVLLHDAPEFAPPELDLDAYLTASYGPQVPRVVRALEHEHLALDSDSPVIVVDDLPVLLASTSDKIVALRSLLRRAAASGDADRFFAARAGLVRLVPHFRQFHRAVATAVPPSMTRALGEACQTLEAATVRARQSAPRP